MRNIQQVEKKEIILSGEEWGVTTVYNLPQSTYWHVSIKPKIAGIKEKYVITFVNRVRADIFKRSSVNTIKIYKFTIIIDDKVAESIYAPTQKDMDLYIAKHAESDSDRFDKAKSVKKAKSNTAKELFSNEFTEDELFGELGDNDMDDLNLNDMLEAWEDFFQEKSEDAVTKAKNLLLSISNHYLTKKVLDSDIYVKHKLTIQAESLSMLFVQLALTKQVLLKLFREIMSDLGNKATYDAFAQQQKFVLEINSFMSKTIQDIIEDMKQARLRFAEKEEEKFKEDELELNKDSGGGMVVTRDRRALMLELGDMMKDVEDNTQDYDEEDIIRFRKEKEKELGISGSDDFNS